MRHCCMIQCLHDITHTTFDGRVGVGSQRVKHFDEVLKDSGERNGGREERSKKRKEKFNKVSDHAIQSRALKLYDTVTRTHAKCD
jgi:hypothetical protein